MSARMHSTFCLPSIINISEFTTTARSPLYTLIFPMRIYPYTDGRAWARREGYERHRGIREGEELTDEDEED
jgi:hypothetical protein